MVKSMTISTSVPSGNSTCRRSPETASFTMPIVNFLALGVEHFRFHQLLDGDDLGRECDLAVTADSELEFVLHIRVYKLVDFLPGVFASDVDDVLGHLLVIGWLSGVVSDDGRVIVR